MCLCPHMCVLRKRQLRGKTSPPLYSFQSCFDSSLRQQVLISPPACFLGGDTRFPDQAAHRGEGVSVPFDGVSRYTLQCLILLKKKKCFYMKKSSRASQPPQKALTFLWRSTFRRRQGAGSTQASPGTPVNENVIHIFL